MAEPKNQRDYITFAVDENPPHLMSAALGFQVVALILAGITLTPIVALKAAGVDPAAGDWVVFAALTISGLMTILQAAPIGPFGAGYVLFMGTSGAFVAVSIGAMEAGGLPLLGSLVAASSLVQFVFSRHLGLFRKIVNPTVGGTVITLIAVSVMPIGFGMLDHQPAAYSGPEHAGLVTAAVTFLMIILLSFYGNAKLRLWGPVIGVIAGCVLAALYGLMDFTRFNEAAWIGLPEVGWPGIDTSFSSSFWIMLPGFMIVTVIGALETYGDGIAIQEVSNRTEKPTNFRVVQGAVNADGLGNLLSGLMGTLPNTTYSTSISVIDLTGVASRRIGLYGGAILLALAASPKISALLQAIPGPVAGVFIFFLIVLLFAHGIRLILTDGFNFDHGVIFGVSLWAGIGFQGQSVFHDLMPPQVAQLLDNGMTTGGITAVLLSLLVSLKRGRSFAKRFPSSLASLPDVLDFVKERGRAMGWRGEELSKLQLAVEEAFLYQIDDFGDLAGQTTRVSMRGDSQTLSIELACAQGNDNIEARLQDLPEAPVGYSEEDLRLRILKSFCDDIEHQQFHGGDYLSMTLTAAPDSAISGIA